MMDIDKDQIFVRTKSISKLVPSRGSVRDYIYDYCRSTTIHGIKYVADKERPLGERITWVVIFILCILGNGYLIRQVWNKWQESPVIVSFAETTTPVWQVPFPAVTICSEVKSRASVFNFSYYMENLNDTEPDILKQMGDVSLLCDKHVTIEGELHVDDSTIDFLIEVAPEISDTAWICKWKEDITENCTHLFAQILTEDGICYTFNMLSKEDLFRGDPVPYYKSLGTPAEGWTLDKGYSPDAPLDTYPYRALAAGAKAGLFVVMRAHTEDSDFYCRGPVQGFKVLLHNPAEFPSVGERYLRTPINQEVIVVVQPNIMTTNPSLLSYSPSRRQCFFPSERYLQFFKIYTQRNCELECLTNYTLKTCGCVAIYMPRYGDTPMCGPASKKCMGEASHKLLLNEIYSSYKDETAGTCHCLPACTALQYNAESSQADYDVKSVLTVYQQNFSEYGGYHASRISIFFKDMQFITSRRSELFGVVDFMANCGGLLGLFCGVSFLSIVELFYYITLRFWGNIKKKNDKKDKTEKEKSENDENIQYFDKSKCNSIDEQLFLKEERFKQ